MSSGLRIHLVFRIARFGVDTISSRRLFHISRDAKIVHSWGNLEMEDSSDIDEDAEEE
jgi:hypothetical protein